MSQADLPYLLAFSRFSKFGAVRLRQIHTRFGSFESAWGAGRADLLQSGVHENLIGEFVALRPTIHPEEEAARVAREGVEIVTLDDERYPRLLKEIYDPPFVLFVRGSLPEPSRVLLAIVGSRRMSAYGERVIETMVPELVQSGVGIVSGLALGCDGCAHHHTVENNGRTYAVLAGGCDAETVSPSRHRHLASRIIGEGGCVMSEFPLGTPHLNHHFPIRNRIISGMSQATLVVEATLASGSLITAKSALDQNRDVLAVPGPITSPLSEGPNRLLKDGARVATSARDVLEVLGLEAREPETAGEPVEPQNANEAAILPHLLGEPVHVDDLARLSRLPTPLLLQTLTALELRDVVVHAGGNRYRRRGSK